MPVGFRSDSEIYQWPQQVYKDNRWNWRELLARDQTSQLRWRVLGPWHFKHFNLFAFQFFIVLIALLYTAYVSSIVLGKGSHLFISSPLQSFLSATKSSYLSCCLICIKLKEFNSTPTMQRQYSPYNWKAQTCKICPKRGNESYQRMSWT